MTRTADMYTLGTQPAEHDGTRLVKARMETATCKACDTTVMASSHLGLDGEMIAHASRCPAARRVKIETLAADMRGHADLVDDLAQQVEDEAGLGPVNSLGVDAYRAEHEQGDPDHAAHLRASAEALRASLRVTPLDDETMASLLEQEAELRDLANALGDRYGQVAGRHSRASYWNEAGIALQCNHSPMLRDGGEFYRPRLSRVEHAWRIARGETSYAADLIERQPDNGRDGCRSMARSGMMVTASSLRVHASNCRVHAGMLDDLAAGKVLGIG